MQFSRQVFAARVYSLVDKSTPHVHLDGGDGVYEGYLVYSSASLFISAQTIVSIQWVIILTTSQNVKYI